MKSHHKNESNLYVLIRSRCRFSWVERSIKSVLSQEFQNYTILFVDDASDYTREQKQVISQLLKDQVVVFNDSRQYSLKNAYDMISQYVYQPEAIIVNLDGDDYLLRRDALSIIANTYKTTACWLTYGNCRLSGHSWWGDRLPAGWVLRSKENERYPQQVERTYGYRAEAVFRPLHPRTWKKWLFDSIQVTDFLDAKGDWFKTCEDQAMMLPMLEMAAGKYAVIPQVIYAYRYNHEQSDWVLNQKQQEIDLQCIRSKKVYAPVR